MPEITYRQDDETVSVGPGNPLPIGGTISQDAGLIYSNVAVTADVAGALAAAAGRRLLGFVVEENAAVAAAAEVRLRHGAIGGDLLFPIILVADATLDRWFGPNGIAIPDGLSIDWVSGSVAISIFYR